MRSFRSCYMKVNTAFNGDELWLHVAKGLLAQDISFAGHFLCQKIMDSLLDVCKRFYCVDAHIYRQFHVAHHSSPVAKFDMSIGDICHGVVNLWSVLRKVAGIFVDFFRH